MKSLNDKFKMTAHIKLNKKTQRGAAMLIAMVVLASVAAFYLMGKYGAVSQKHERQESRVGALADAKKALIAYAVTYIDTHPGEMGFLPCPDTDEGGLNPEEGQQDGTCGARNANSIGRLPYRAIDLPPLKDDSNECLWYAVSGYYKNAPKTEMLNEDTNGMLQVSNAAGTVIYGNNPEDRVVAVVIAPGTNLNQDRSGGVVNTEQCGGNYTVTNYLEGNAAIPILNSNVSAADTVDDFIKAGTNTESNPVSPYNDLIMTITRDEIWDALKRRRDYQSSMENLTQEIARCLVVYGEAGSVKNLPWPAELNLAAAGYRLDASYKDAVAPAANGHFGRLPEDVQNSENQLDNNPSGGGGGGGGGSPPSGGPACTDCWNVYQQALADALAEWDQEKLEANQDWSTCAARRPWNTRPCDNALARELADAEEEYNEDVQDALTDYNNCLSANSCTAGGGGGGGGTCVDCQGVYDTAIAVAADVRDQTIADAQGPDYIACRQAGNSRRFCNRQRRNTIRQARRDYRNAVNQAQTDLTQCIANNNCGAGGSKGITNILSTCLLPAELDLWRNWKDHFFYAVSGSYAPDSTDVSCTSAGAQCVSTSGNDHAAIVLFSGERQPVAGISRNDPVTGDVDTKQTIGNYLEGNNASNYPDANGNGVYDSTIGNDYLYCVNDTDPLTTGNCP